jgi:corrinoid protein of di/trimethylamine methyltransferase
MNKQDAFNQMIRTVLEGDKDAAERLAQTAVSRNWDLNEVVEKGFVPGIQEAGRLWENGEYFLPELIAGAEAMKAAMRVFQPELEKSRIKAASAGKIIIGTISGDIHDIGKNLVASMLSANGFDVLDLGADVKLEHFLDKAEAKQADLICVSALLTTTMLRQKLLIQILRERDPSGKYKLLVGGAPVTKKWAENIGADGYAENAMSAVSLAKALMRKTGGDCE